MSESEVVIEFGDDRLVANQRAVRAAAFRQLIEIGEPADMVAIAENARIPQHVVGEVLAILAGRGSAQLDDGHVLGIAGLSVTPTRHRILLPHGERWTWCALDAIGIVGALQSGTITSRSPNGTMSLRLEDGVFRPQGMAIFIADGYGMTSSLSQWCPLVDFFNDEAAADRWAEQNGASGHGVAVARLALVAAKRWSTIIEDS